MNDKEVLIENIPAILKADWSKSKTFRENMPLVRGFLDYLKNSPERSMMKDFVLYQRTLRDKDEKILIWWIANYLFNSEYCWNNEKHSFKHIATEYDVLRKHKIRGRRYENRSRRQQNQYRRNQYTRVTHFSERRTG